MIGKDCSKYCCEDVSKIENYSVAIADTENVWHCHHRKEICGGKVVRRKRLIADGLYYNRPASELIFVLPTKHYVLHHGRAEKDMLAKYPKLATFQDYLCEKAKILKKYEFWNQRNPEKAADNNAKMQDELDELLQVYELCERRYFRKVAEAQKYGGSIERKLLTDKKGENHGYC